MSTVKQVALKIPDEILTGLLSEKYTQIGSVIRDNTGKIVKLLEEVPLQKVKNYKNLAIGLGIVAIVSTVGLVFVTIKSSKNKENDNIIIPKCVEDYNVSFYNYLKASSNGSLNIDIINRLISALNTIKENYDSGKISIDFLTEQFKTLVFSVYDYTRKLAESNSFELLNELKEPTYVSANDTIINLQHYLEVQKQIFKKAL